MKWQKELLTTAHSDGDMSLYRFTEELLSFQDSIEFDASEVILLSCDFANGQICASGSTGKLYVAAVTECSLQKLTECKAHDMEAWIAAFDKYNANVIFTGADDCKLKLWDLRSTAMVKSLSL